VLVVLLPACRGQVDSLVSDVEPRPHLVRVVAGGLPGAQEPLQLGHRRRRGGAPRLLPARRPGAAPGPGEPGHERHAAWRGENTDKPSHVREERNKRTGGRSIMHHEDDVTDVLLTCGFV